MIDKILDKYKSCIININFQKNIPAWSLTHYIQQTSYNYMKLFLTQTICELLSSKINENDIYISDTSIDLYNAESINYTDFKNLKNLGSNEKKQNDFWKILKYHDRPVVFYLDKNKHYPLYDLNKDYTFAIKKIIVNSPPVIDLEGIGAVLLDLFFGKSREIRSIINWQNEQINNAGKNIESIARASDVVNSKNISSGIKKYANTVLDDLIKKQKLLNDKLGINEKNINVKI